MFVLLLSFCAVLLASAGSSASLLLAHLDARAGRAAGVRVVAVLVAGGSVAAILWAACAAKAGLPPVHLRSLAALALVLAAVGLLRRNRVRLPGEPTRSLGAILLVLLARQIADSPRLILFAILLACDEEIGASIGGVGGALAAIALAIGWLGGVPMTPLLRKLLAAMALMAAFVIGSSTFFAAAQSPEPITQTGTRGETSQAIVRK